MRRNGITIHTSAVDVPPAAAELAGCDVLVKADVNTNVDSNGKVFSKGTVHPGNAVIA